MYPPEVEYFLDLIEPHIKIQEEFYDRLIESRIEIVKSFRRLRPKVTQPEVKITPVQSEDKITVPQPVTPQPEKDPVMQQPKISSPISLDELEKHAEAILEGLGI